MKKNKKPTWFSGSGDPLFLRLLRPRDPEDLAPNGDTENKLPINWMDKPFLFYDGSWCHLRHISWQFMFMSSRQRSSKMYMLPAKWIRQADLFRLAQISPAEWDQGPNIYKANMFLRNISLLYIFLNAL